MNTRTLFIVSIVGLIFVASLEAAKPTKGKNAKEVKAEPKSEKVDAHAAEDLEAEEELLISRAAPKLVRPRTLKVLTAYDKCKLECKKQRDQEGLFSYVENIRSELAVAEAMIAEQEGAAAEGHSEYHQYPNFPSDSI